VYDSLVFLMSLAAGSRLGPYEVVSPLGAGGMGEVYRARDTRLDRYVAIKILPERLAADAAAVSRFEQEGRAVAALSHPNILAIHDVGLQDGVAYVVTELLDGDTLRDRLSSGRLPLRKALDYAMHVAQGLAAAHAKNITHRDIKPENLFVTADGVKILDFGLAKVATPAADVTRTSNLPTDPGTVLGTAGYLSPEQAQGKSVDHRSDIFSLGAVLYEMATGLRAFKGDSAIDSLHKVIHSEPPPIDTAAPDAPPELRFVLAKCLAKDPDERYQSTRDLVIDLKGVARALDSSPRLSAPPVPAPGARRGFAVAVATVVVAIAIIGAALWWRNRPSEPAAAAAAGGGPSMEQVTSLGTVIDAVISPDGKYMAYVSSENARQSLWIRQIATASTLELVPAASVGYWGATFSPDSSEIFYVVASPERPDRALYRVSTLGGAPRELLSGLDSFPVFSPDGKQLAYVRAAFPEPGTSALMVAGVDGSNPRPLATRRSPDFFAPIFFTAPSWSPDGATIICPMINRAGTPTKATLVLIRVADGTEAPFPRYEWVGAGQATWTPDGQGVYVVAGEENAGARNHQIWWVSAREASRRRITSDLLDYRTVSLTADGSTMMTVAADNASAIWTVPVDTGEATRLRGGRYEGLSGVAATPDGRILYRAVDGGLGNLWIMNTDGSGRRQLTTDAESSNPVVTLDGRSMVFERQGALWQSDLDGQNLRAIPNTTNGTRPAMMPDGKSVLYVLTAGGFEQTWKAPLDGSAPPVRMLAARAFGGRVSPDGKQIAFYYQETLKSGFFLVVMPINSDKPTHTFPARPSSTYAAIDWTPDSKALLHNAAVDDRSNIWLQPLSGGPPKQLTRFADQVIYAFSRSQDGKQLIIARGTLSRDAVIIRNLQ
jgi:serine/threonine protein kinase/Tol biopolymer transport system component